MNKNIPQNLYICGHPSSFLAEEVSAFHAEVIARRLAASNLSEGQKKFVLGEISKQIKEQNAGGTVDSALF